MNWNYSRCTSERRHQGRRSPRCDTHLSRLKLVTTLIGSRSVSHTKRSNHVSRSIVGRLPLCRRGSASCRLHLQPGEKVGRDGRYIRVFGVETANGRCEE